MSKEKPQLLNPCLTSNVAESYESGEKRCCIPGLILAGTCPNCRRDITRDFSREYISYPTFNAPIEVYICCEHCEICFFATIEISITAKIVTDK